MIYQVQNKQYLLEGEDVSHQNDKMTKLEFLDVKRIADYAFNVYEASNADTGDLFLLKPKEIGFLNGTLHFWSFVFC